MGVLLLCSHDLWFLGYPWWGAGLVVCVGRVAVLRLGCSVGGGGVVGGFGKFVGGGAPGPGRLGRGLFFGAVAGLGLWFCWGRALARVVSVDLAKFLRTPVSIEHLRTTCIPCLLVIITLRFTCGEGKIWSNIKKYQNIMIKCLQNFLLFFMSL